MFSSIVYDWGLSVIRAVQSISFPQLTVFMRVVGFITDKPIYFVMLPFFFWCVNEKRGLYLSTTLLFSTSLNVALKNLFAVPRPYFKDPSVALAYDSEYSTPSGHSQAAAVFWPLVFSFFYRKNTRVPAGSGSTGTDTRRKCFSEHAVKLFFAVFPPLAIGFSRVYLGVHYPSDVFLGLILGFLISTGALLFIPQIKNIAKRLPKMYKILLIALITAALNAISLSDLSMSASFFGFTCGYVLLTESGGFCASKGSFAQKTLRALFGFAVLFAVYAGIKLLFSSAPEEYRRLLRFIRYAAFSFTGTYVIPKLFIVFKLAEKKGIV